MKILTIVGARPQFIKAATVSRAIAQHNQHHPEQSVQEVLVHTGQHYDANMSDVFFEQMQIPKPDYHFSFGGLSHGAMTGQMLEKIEQVIFDEQPTVVLVYGDTNSTLAGALAAAKLHVPVAHVEAGLRSHNMQMPEEINRLLTDQIASWLFCPTKTAVKNLQQEGITRRSEVSVRNIGDVMYDAALFYQEIAEPSEEIVRLMESLNQAFYLATVHRAENTDDAARLSGIIQALDTISEHFPVVLPLHPRTRKLLANHVISNIHLVDPVSYFDMLALLSHCQGVFTDSGGLQKEAYFFKKPCVTLREQTEWVELVQAGVNRLVGASYADIIAAEKELRHFASNADELFKPLYGQGNAAQQILDALVSHFYQFD